MLSLIYEMNENCFDCLSLLIVQTIYIRTERRNRTNVVRLTVCMVLSSRSNIGPGCVFVCMCVIRCRFAVESMYWIHVCYCAQQKNRFSSETHKQIRYYLMSHQPFQIELVKRWKKTHNTSNRVSHMKAPWSFHYQANKRWSIQWPNYFYCFVFSAPLSVSVSLSLSLPQSQSQSVVSAHWIFSISA